MYCPLSSGSTLKPSSGVRKVRLPVLDRLGEQPLFDSDVICTYLDGLHGEAPLIPVDGEARWDALLWQAIAQGISDAGIAVRWEDVRRPAETRYAPFCDGQAEKLIESYAWLDASLGQPQDLHVGHIAVATVLDWIEFRDLPSFRNHVRLSRWLDTFKECPSMQATPLSGNTVDRWARSRLRPPCSKTGAPHFWADNTGTQRMSARRRLHNRTCSAT